MKKIQLIEKEISVFGETVLIREELEKDYQFLSGIAILATYGTGHILKSSSVNGKELFPKNFEIDFIQSNDFVPPNERFFKLENIPASGYEIELEYQDSGVTGITYPYTVRFYLELEKAPCHD